MEHVGVRGVPKFLDFHTPPGLAVHRDRRGARRAVPRKTASLEKARTKRAERTEVTADWVVEELRIG